jgi:hypothetical protein
MTKSAVDSVREECAPYRNMSLHEKARLIGLVCADVPAILARYTPEHIARMYALDDRLPESTLEALARLRRQARTSR